MFKYAIKLENGQYLKQEYNGDFTEVIVTGTDSPINADFFDTKKNAADVLKRMFNRDTAFPVVFDEDNPPGTIVKLEVNIKEAE